MINEADVELLSARHLLQKNKPVFICSFNPTAEEMAKYLIDNVFPDLFAEDKIKITKVVLYETENCFVELER